MKMEGIEHLLNPEQDKEGFQAMLKKQIEVFAKGLDSEIGVDFESYDWSRKRERGQGLVITFTYKGEKSVLRDEDPNDNTLFVAENELTKFYEEVRKNKKD